MGDREGKRRKWKERVKVQVWEQREPGTKKRDTEVTRKRWVEKLLKWNATYTLLIT